MRLVGILLACLVATVECALVSDLQLLIDSAPELTVVNLPSGTHTDCTVPLTLNRSLTIRGASSPATVIDCLGAGRALLITGGTMTLSGITVRGTVIDETVSERGAAMRVEGGATLAIEDMVFDGDGVRGLNTRGGGIFLHGSHLSVLRSIFVNNEVLNQGGAIYAFNRSTLAVIDSTFTSNTAPVGGAIRAYLSDMSFSGCDFANNYGMQGGGDVYATSGGTVTIDRCTFTGSSGGTGGCVATSNGDVNVTHSTFHNCTGTLNGGAMYLAEAALMLHNVTVVGARGDSGGGIFLFSPSPCVASELHVRDSVATIHGGALYSYQGTGLTVTGSQFVHNKADNYAGGIYAYETLSVVVEGSTIERNEALSYGGGLYFSRVNSLVQNCTLDANMANYGAAAMISGDITVYHPGATFNDCVFSRSLSLVGAVMAARVVRVNISSSVFYENEGISYPSGVGGGNNGADVFVQGGHVLLSDCLLSASVGGSLLAELSGLLELHDSTVSAPADGLFSLVKVSDANFVCLNSTVADGRAPTGGGMYISASTVHVECSFFNNTASANGGGIAAHTKSIITLGSTCVFDDNNATRGGGVFVQTGSNASLVGGVYRNNHAIDNGGALGSFHNEDDMGHLQVSENTLMEDNTANNGGAIATQYASFEITGARLVRNSAAVRGGALYFLFSRNLTVIRDVLLDGNMATFGGGLSMQDTALEVYDSTFQDCTAAEGGGGLANSVASHIEKVLRVQNCTFTRCRVLDGDGGGLTSWSPSIIEDSLFFQNTATFGAGLQLHGGAAPVPVPHVVQNCTFDSNVGVFGDFNPGYSGGAGASVEGNMNTTIVGCVFVNNQIREDYLSTADGAGLFMGPGLTGAADFSRLAVYSCTFTGNTAFGGAAIGTSQLANSYLEISSCVFRENVGIYPGSTAGQGTVFAFVKQMTLSESEFVSNIGEQSGALSLNSELGENMVSTTLFDNNTSVERGASSALVHTGRITVVGCTFTNQKDAVMSYGEATLTDNVFENSGGSYVIFSRRSLNTSSNRFNAISADFCYAIEATTTAHIIGDTFVGHVGRSSGSVTATVVGDDADVVVESSIFHDGGHFGLRCIGGHLVVRDSSFVDYYSSVYVGDSGVAEIRNVTVVGAGSSAHSMLFDNGAVADMYNCAVIAAEAVVILQARVSMFEVVVRESIARGVNMVESNTTMTNCSFLDCRAENVVVETVTNLIAILRIVGCTFSHTSVAANSATHGSCLSFIGAELSVIDSVFDRCLIHGDDVGEAWGGAVFAAPFRQFTLLRCVFRHCAVEGMLRVTGSRESDGGAVYVDIQSGGPTISISECEFDSNHAGSAASSSAGISGRGGALFVRENSFQRASVSITDCTFTHNVISAGDYSAEYGCDKFKAGGAIYTTACRVDIRRTTISGSSAVYGGALFSENPRNGHSTQTSCSITLEDVKVYDNFATQAPAWYITKQYDWLPLAPVLTNVTVENNTAVYGPPYGGMYFMARFAPVSVWNISEAVSSGGQFEVWFAMHDFTEQIAPQCASALFDISGENVQLSFSDPLEFDIRDNTGTYLKRNVTVAFPQELLEKQSYIELNISSINDFLITRGITKGFEEWRYDSNRTLRVPIKACADNEYVVTSGSGFPTCAPLCSPGWGLANGRCQPCPPGSRSPDGICITCTRGEYSSSPASLACSLCQPGQFAEDENSTECMGCQRGRVSTAGSALCSGCPSNEYTRDNVGCNTCPQGGDCRDGELFIKDGWYQDPNLKLYKCANQKICPGGSLSQCPPNHKPSSFLCAECEPGYAMGETCGKCPGPGVAFLLVMVTIVAVFVLLAYFIYTADDEVTFMSVAIRVLLSHLQVLGVVVSAASDTKFFSLFAWSAFSNGDVSNGPSYGCFMGFHASFAFHMVLPIIVTVVITIAVVVLNIVKKLGLDARGIVSSAARYSLVALFVLYPTLSSNILKVFNCRYDTDVPGGLLVADLSIKCSSPAHIAATVFAAMFTVVYIVGIPLVGSYALYRRRHDLRERAAGRKHEPLDEILFIFKNYRERHYYWEITLLARKSVLSAAVVFLRGEPLFQTEFLAIVLAVSMVMNSSVKPFPFWLLDYMETASSGLLATSFALLGVMRNEDVGGGIRSFAEGVTIAANFLFLIVLVLLILASLKGTPGWLFAPVQKASNTEEVGGSDDMEPADVVLTDVVTGNDDLVANASHSPPGAPASDAPTSDSQKSLPDEGLQTETAVV